MNRLHRIKAFAIPKLRRVLELFTSQGITMAGNLLYGLLCVRLLPIPEYAKFVVVFAFLSTLTILMDISFSGTLLALIGERVGDSQVIADYLATLRQLTHWTFLILAPLAAIAYPWIVRKQHWGGRTVVAMIAILFVASWCARLGGAYGSVLIVRRDRKTWYRVQMASSLGTLVLLIGAWAMHALNGSSAIVINVVGIVYVASAYFFRSRRLLGVAGVATREKRVEMIHLAAPAIPNTIFYALQGQISLFLMTLFGQAHSVASLGALARLGQAYALIGQINPLLIEPYFANLPKSRLKTNYILAFVMAVLVCGCGTLLAYFFPQIFLWILGGKYSGLHHEVFLMITVSGISYAYSVVFNIHIARKFVYWWNGISIICLTVLVEALFIWKVDLSSLTGVLTMSLATAGVWLVVTVMTGIYGFIHGPREMAKDARGEAVLQPMAVLPNGLLDE